MTPPISNCTLLSLILSLLCLQDISDFYTPGCCSGFFAFSVQNKIVFSITDNLDNIAVDNAGYTANSNLFACGDAVSGASLVVKAMASGRNVARSIDRFLQTN